MPRLKHSHVSVGTGATFYQARTTACTTSSAIGSVQAHFCLKKVKPHTIVCKLSNQLPSICIRDPSTPIRRSRQHGIAGVDKCYGKDDVLRCLVSRGVQEWGIHKVIGTQGIPVNAVIKVRNGKGFLIRRYRRAASVSV